MAQVNNMTSEQVKEKFERLVGVIQEYDGTSGRPEEEWRKDQQDLMRLLSQNPLELYHLSSEIKVKIEAIVKGYLEWSFNAYW